MCEKSYLLSEKQYMFQILTSRLEERERCVKIVEAMKPSGGRAWSDAQLACFEALTEAAENMRNDNIVIDPEGRVQVNAFN